MAARLTAYVVVGIVAATLIAGLMSAQRDDTDGPVDIIIHNAKVYTAGTNGTMAEAVAIRGNQILRVGSEREVTRLRKPQTTMIDAKGAAVLPGFNDAHVHFIDGGLGLERIDLADAVTVDEVQSRIRTWASNHADASWVLGRGWYYQPFPGGLPTRQQLDTVVSDRPAQIISYDGHTSWVNTRALRLARITKKTPNPPGGVIVKDPRTGEPTGVLKEAAMALVGDHVPKTTRGDRAAALRSAIGEAQRNGVTSVQNASGDAVDFELYAEARRDGDLGVRMYAALSAPAGLTESSIADLDVIAKRYPDDPVFKAGAIKIMLDGVIEARTAAMLAPYADDTDSGTPAIDPDELNRIVRVLDRGGWQIMTHASGDRAVNMALTAYEHAVRSNPLPDRGRRHRIEHIETVDTADLPRFGALGVVASMQPYLGNPSDSEIDVWFKHVGPERSSRALALQQHRRRSRPAHVRQRLARRPAEPNLRPAHRRDANDARGDTRGRVVSGRAAGPQDRDRCLHIRRGVGLIRRAAQREPRGRHARRSRRAVRGHLRGPGIASGIDPRGRHDLRRPHRLSPDGRDDELAAISPAA